MIFENKIKLKLKKTKNIYHMETNLTENSGINLENFKDFQGFDIFWTFSVPEQRYLFISSSFEALIGYKVKDIYLNPKLWLNLIQDYDNNRISRKIKDDKIYFESTYTIKNFYGENIKIEEILFPIFDETDQLIQLQGYMKVKNKENSKIEIIDEFPSPFFSIEKSNSQWFVKSVSKKLKDLLIGTSVTNDFRNTEFENLINSIIERLDELKSNES
ncbi:MAG: PAS domain-containing protein, partial [Ignavibacteria bacterium]